jgi:hypothetical protein
MCLEVRLRFVARTRKKRKFTLSAARELLMLHGGPLPVTKKCLAGDIRGVATQCILER